MNEAVHNGIHKVIHNKFWQLNVGHVALAAMIFVGWGRLSERFDTVVTNQTRDEGKLEWINQNGTDFSRSGIKLETVSLQDHTERLRKIEEAVSSIGVMNEKIDRLREDVKTVLKK